MHSCMSGNRGTATAEQEPEVSPVLLLSQASARTKFILSFKSLILKNIHCLLHLHKIVVVVLSFSLEARSGSHTFPPTVPFCPRCGYGIMPMAMTMSVPCCSPQKRAKLLKQESGEAAAVLCSCEEATQRDAMLAGADCPAAAQLCSYSSVLCFCAHFPARQHEVAWHKIGGTVSNSACFLSSYVHFLGIKQL